MSKSAQGVNNRLVHALMSDLEKKVSSVNVRGNVVCSAAHPEDLGKITHKWEKDDSMILVANLVEY